MMRNDEMQTDRAIEGAEARMAQAWQWLCGQRMQAPEHADIWHIRWEKLNSGEGWLTALTHRVLRGEYRLAPLQLQGQNENRKAVWGAQDALVLKWAALSLQHVLPLHPRCEHVKGHGGGKPSIEKLHGLLTTNDNEKKTDAIITSVTAEIRHYTWVCRTDIRGYYRNINKQTLINQVNQHVTSPVLRDLVQQYVHYTVEDGGTFHTPEKGISRGCPLSPLMGALHLVDMDEHFSNQPNIHYARYMDDVIILAKTRWSLKKHTKRLMQWFGEYGFEAHPDKTQIGRTEKGFDWMGAWLTHEGVTDIAPRAKANHREKVRRLYEQLARLPKWKRKSAAPKVHARVSTYRKRWHIWAASILTVVYGPIAVAKGDIVVLGPISGAGSLGAIFPTSGSTTGTAKTAPNGSADFGGLCLSPSAGSCSLDNKYTAIHTPLGWGIEPIKKKGLVFVPRGLITVTWPTTVNSDMVATVDTATGLATTRTGKTYTACTPIQGDTGKRGTFYSLNSGSSCPYKTSDAWGLTTTAINVTINYNLQLQMYATSPLDPGKITVSPLFVGLHTQVDPTADVVLPDNIVVVGLLCTLSPGKGSTLTFPGSGVAASSVNGVLTSGLTASDLGLTAQCTGSNSTNANVAIGYTLMPTGGGATVSNNKGLSVSTQKSFYMNFTNNGSPDCDLTRSTAIPLDGLTSQSIASVATGKDLPQTPLNLGVALCTTGDMTQPPGTYAMMVTASIVSY